MESLEQDFAQVVREHKGTIYTTRSLTVNPAINSPKYLPNVIMLSFMLQIYKRLQYLVTLSAKYFALFTFLGF